MTANALLPMALILLTQCGPATATASGEGNPLAGFRPEATRVATGFGSLTEGPLWSDALGGLLFSALDAPTRECTGRTLLLRPPDRVEVLRDPSCNGNGLAFDSAGRLLVAEHGSRSLRRELAEGGFETLVSHYEGLPLNAPNDLAVRSDGTIYFTDPDFVRPAPPRLGFNGLFRYGAGAELVLEARMDSPNGVALSPDEATLYVTNMQRGKLEAFRVLADGSLDGRRTLISGLASPDGMTVDPAGNLYVALQRGGRGAVAVHAPDGRRWGEIAIPEPARNCAIGGKNRRTLFVTAGTSVYRVDLAIPGSTPDGVPGKGPRAAKR